MTHDFALDFRGKWKDEQAPIAETSIYTVSYDQTSTVYVIRDEDYDAFIEWVALQLESDNGPREDGEGAGDYLERIGVFVILWLD